jgi:hypothetical protein
MSAGHAALISHCAECRAVWPPTDEDRWQAHLAGDDLEAPAKLVFYCPDCAEREFNGAERI